MHPLTNFLENLSSYLHLAGKKPLKSPSKKAVLSYLKNFDRKEPALFSAESSPFSSEKNCLFYCHNQLFKYMDWNCFLLHSKNNSGNYWDRIAFHFLSEDSKNLKIKTLLYEYPQNEKLILEIQDYKSKKTLTKEEYSQRESSLLLPLKTQTLRFKMYLSENRKHNFIIHFKDSSL